MTTKASEADVSGRELLDCPFCEGEATYREETLAPMDCREYVRCKRCGAETALQPTPEIAAPAWNRRAAIAKGEK